jgi:long-subunit fatty acid transport protein
VTLGGAFAVNEMFSIALGVRGMYVMNTYKGEATLSYGGTDYTAELDTEQTGMGVGGIIGFNVALEGINIGLRYESETSIELENKTKVDDFGYYPDGVKTQANIPATLGLGVVFTVMPELNIGADFCYYFDSYADWEGAEDDYDDSWEAGISAEFKVTPTLLVSAGYLYAKTGHNEKTNTDLGFGLDSHTVGLGCKFSASEVLDINAGFSKTFYVESDESDASTPTGNTYQQDCYLFAVGVNYRLGL